MAPCWGDQWDEVAIVVRNVLIVLRGKSVSDTIHLVLYREKMERCVVVLVAAKMVWNERSGNQRKGEDNAVFQIMISVLVPVGIGKAV